MNTMKQCNAKSKRSGLRCKNFALKTKDKCKFHGGKSTGPKTKQGKSNSRKAHLKHGFRTKAHVCEVKSIKNFLKNSADYLKNFKYEH